MKNGLPTPWTGSAVVAVHGSWGRQPTQEPAALWMARGATTKSLLPAVTIIDGFQEADGSRWGRPVEAVPGPDGSLYVSDDTFAPSTDSVHRPTEHPGRRARVGAASTLCQASAVIATRSSVV
jgi:glucose/arabinose dehydrogenase